MTAPQTIDFAGTDEELETKLREFARLAGDVSLRNFRGEWRFAGGELLSTNPNTHAWHLYARRVEGKLTLCSPARPGKMGRIAAFRSGQVADFLLKGIEPRREPFATFGTDVPELAASFAWVVAGALGAMALSFVACTVASITLLPIAQIAARSAASEAAGAIPLPSRAELDSIGIGFRIAAAMVFAGPLAFFFGLVHASALALADVSPRAARLPQASFLFATLLLLFAFFPLLPVYAAVPFALLIPLATHAGYLLVWDRRREKPSRPGRVPLLAVLLPTIAVAAFLVLTAADGKDRNDRLALFRDDFMLGHSPGKAAAAFYYRHTLYSFDAIKPDAVSRKDFPAESLRGLNVLAWWTMCYAGPIFAAAVFVAIFGPGLSIIFRVLPRRSALISALGVVVSIAGLVAWNYSHKREIRALNDAPPERIAAGLGHSEESVRHAAALQAFRRPHPSLADPLLKASDDPDLRIRLWAVAALGKTRDPRALQKLLDRLKDPEFFVRYRAAEGLGFLGHKDAVEPLQRLMREGSWYEGEYALGALRRIDPRRF